MKKNTLFAAVLLSLFVVTEIAMANSAELLLADNIGSGWTEMNMNGPPDDYDYNLTVKYVAYAPDNKLGIMVSRVQRSIYYDSNGVGEQNTGVGGIFYTSCLGRGFDSDCPATDDIGLFKFCENESSSREPGSVWLLGFALIALAGIRKKLSK
ncbi:hypothetical protein [Desulfonema magnum]|uniref:PEP-CTERM protein-sorting domain-containing protein n=1 Tax=Desulfonema magnum TaxID=45655 RepID=A0A975GKD7_9BACT|nr:hypothetical protein [Desulfonema magnum]QTA84405.1 Uncharacterized protein dnm_004010 [Desulfonema magnum]